MVERSWHWVHGHIHGIAVIKTSVSPAVLHWRTCLWMEAGWKTFAVVLQHCSEAECLCIDLAERENREIFHMFISRPPRDKQPSPSQSLLLLKAQPAQVIKILLSQGEITLLLQKHGFEKTATVLCRSLSSSWLPLFIKFVQDVCLSMLSSLRRCTGYVLTTLILTLKPLGVRPLHLLNWVDGEGLKEGLTNLSCLLSRVEGVSGRVQNMAVRTPGPLFWTVALLVQGVLY